MCGISGTVGLADQSVISRMVNALHHRGPDDLGVYVDPAKRAALGHTRLSIIDLSDAAHQPMPYRNGRMQIVFNGEIYNYKELRSELQVLGHQFLSHSDTEVLVAAYAEWGEECVERLDGMFAFAILDRGPTDRGAVKLFLARDRLGIKPLYYALVDSVFIFASEIKALLASRVITRKVDRQAVWHYLSLGSIPQPRTILADVNMLMPAHVMSYSLRSGISIRKYWDVADSGKSHFADVHKYCKAEAGRHLRTLLEQAAKRHLVADVPIGAFLSGGIDSTTVVGLMSQLSRERVRTFSVGFSGKHKQFDELKWARIAAGRFDTDHTEIVVDGREVAGYFDEIVHSIDQPSLDGTNTYVVSKATGEAVKVAISGLGGDELFAGYPHFRELSNIAKVEQRLSWFGESGRKRIFRACPGRFMRNKALFLLSPGQRYETLRNLCKDSDKLGRLSPSFVSDDLASTLSDVYAPWLRMSMDAVSEISYVEVQGYLANTLLRDVDAMSMAHSLEVRPVLLDHRVAEFAFALPSRLKMEAGENKPALVNAVRDLLPESLLSRPKAGFELPLSEWLTGPLKDRAVSTYSSTMARSLFSECFLGETVRSIKQCERVSSGVWANMMLLEWLVLHQCEL